MPGPDYTIFAITDLTMCTALHNGDTSFLQPFTTGARMNPKFGENPHEESPYGEREIDPSYGFDDFLNSMDILLCGRQTYDLIMHHAKGQWPYPRKRLIVLSATSLSESLPFTESGYQLSHYPPPPHAEQFSGTPYQLVQLLEKEGNKPRKFKRESVWVMGGPNVRGELLKIGAVERMEIVMVPRIIAGGIPVWSFGGLGNGREDGLEIPLQMIDCRSYENGVVSLSYAVSRR